MIKSGVGLMFVILILSGGVYGQSTTTSFPSEFLSKTFSDSQLEAMVANCPLLKKEEVADAYRDSRRALSACPEARTIEMDVQSVYSDYQKHLNDLATRKSGFSVSGNTDEITLIQRRAVDTLGRLEAFKGIKCAKSYSEYIGAALPLLSMVNSTGSYSLAEGAVIGSRIAKLFQHSKTSIAQKLAACSINKTFKEARGEACRVTAYSEKYYNTHGIKMDEVSEAEYIHTTKQDEDSTTASLNVVIASGSRTNTFKLLNTYDKFKSEILSLNANDTTVESATATLAKLNTLKETLQCKTSNDERLSRTCRILESMSQKLNFLSSDLVDPESFPKRSNYVESLKIELRGLKLLEDPIKGIFPNRNEMAVGSAPSGVTKDTKNEAANGITAYVLLTRPQSSVFSIYKAFALPPKDPAVAIKLLEQGLSDVPDIKDVDERLCQATTCVWNSAELSVKFLKKPEQLKLPTGWNFAVSQTPEVLSSAGGDHFALGESYLRQSSVRKLLSSCIKLNNSKNFPACKVDCEPQNHFIPVLQNGIADTAKSPQPAAATK